MHDRSTVLVIEPDSDLARAVRVRLQAVGFDVVVAFNHREAFDAIAARVPAVIVMDTESVHVDGLTLLRQLRQVRATRWVPVLGFTSCISTNPYRCLGVDAWIDKPYRAEELVGLLEMAMRRRGVRHDSSSNFVRRDAAHIDHQGVGIVADGIPTRTDHAPLTNVR